MSAVIVKRIVQRELEEHGIRCSGNVPLRAVEGNFGRIALLALESDSSADLQVGTPTERADHAMIMFITAIGLRGRPLQEVEHRYLVIADSDSVVKMRCAGRWKVTKLLIPRSSISSSRLFSGGVRTYAGHRQLERAVQRFIDTLLETRASVSSRDEDATEQLLIEMSRALLLARLRSDVPGSRRDLHDRATALIQQQCGDPALTPARIARDIGTSLRQLQVAFADAGTTVAGEVRRQRALKAHAMLTDQRFAALSIDQVRERSGFQTPMSFRRALLRNFESTPGDLRRRSITLSTTPAPSARPNEVSDVCRCGIGGAEAT